MSSAIDTLRDALFGNPPAPDWKPSRSGVLAAFMDLDLRVAAQLLGVASYATVAALPAVTATNNGTMARVYADGTAANNTFWIVKAGAWTKDVDFVAVLQALVQPLVTQAQNAASLATSAAFSIPLTIGKCTGMGATASSATVAYCMGQRFRQRAMLIGAKMNVGAASTITVTRARPNYDAGKHVRVGIGQLTAPTTGVVTFTQADIVAMNGGLPFIFEIDDRLTFGGNAVPKYTPSSEPIPYFPTTFDEAGASMALAYGGGSFDAEFYFLLAPALPTHADAVFERYDTFSVIPAEWADNGGTATVSGGAINLAGTNFNNRLCTQLTYGLDNRVARVEFQFTSIDSQFFFVTDPLRPVDSGQLDGSGFRLDRATNKLMVYNRFAGGTTEPAIDAVDQISLVNLDGSAFTLLNNRTYTLIVTKLFRDYRIELIDALGKEYFVYTVSDGGLDTYTGAASPNTKHGLLHGSVSFGTIAGTAKLLKYRMTAPYDTFGVLLDAGDSKTEGFTVNIGQRHGDLIAADYPARKVAISGVGGASSLGLINRLWSILEGLRPANVLINIGTNTGDESTFAANLTVLLRMITSIGARPIFATVANSAAKSTSVSALTGTTTVDFAKTMTVSGGGSTVIAGYYAGVQPDNGAAFNDGLHENAIGHRRERAEIKRAADL